MQSVIPRSLIPLLLRSALVRKINQEGFIHLISKSGIIGALKHELEVRCVPRISALKF